jgi:hypothetical protein
MRPENPRSPLPENICKSCGNRFKGYYCNICGEKVLQGRDKSFSAFLNNILIAVTFTDSKLIKTLWWVIRKPGYVSNEFAEGRTIKYVNPLSLFFVLNLIYFLFPVIQLFNASLNTQLLAPQRLLVRDMVAHKMMSMQMTDIASFSLIYNQKTTGLAKLMVMVFVVITSLPLNFLYRKKNRYFSDHVGFTVELACFNLFVNAICLTLVAKLLGLGHYLDELTVTFIFVSSNLYFLLKSGMTFYREKGWRLVVKSIVMLLLLRVALEIYRAILFIVTIWAL